MDSPSPLERKLAREIAARKQAEKLLENKSLELYEANQQLQLVLAQLKKQTHKDLRKLDFEQQINEALIHFGRAFLSRTLDDGLIANFLERIQSSSVILRAGVFISPNLLSTVIADQFGHGSQTTLESIKPYAVWDETTLRLPLEVDYAVIGELCVEVEPSVIEADFIESQIALVGELLCNAISRQLIMTSNQEARARAEESEKATKEFVAMINHELRTPLNGLLGSAELLSETELNEEQRALLTNLAHSGGLLRHIINDILDFSKMSAGMMELIPKTFLWADIRAMLLGVFEPRAREKGIGFIIDECTELPEAFTGDFERISQILVNLVGNAVKFTEQGQVSVSAKWQEGQLHIKVVDTGIGIDFDSLEQLFTPFVQADRTAKRNYEGTGLGLAISKNLVELMGGEIAADSEKGKGSCFSFHIPLTLASIEEWSSGQVEAKKHQKPLDDLTILVVDDIRMNQVIINQMLKKLAIVPDIANNGLEAVEAVTQRHYDLIFMDCRMPEMDGFEATQYLRDQNYTLPIIALTAGTTLEERERCIESGMNDILSKPYTAKDLHLMLEKWG